MPATARPCAHLLPWQLLHWYCSLPSCRSCSVSLYSAIAEFLESVAPAICHTLLTPPNPPPLLPHMAAGWLLRVAARCQRWCSDYCDANEDAPLLGAESSFGIGWGYRRA